MIRHLKNNVVGYLALVVALSGTSYAAVQLQAGQVKTKHLANQAVTSKKIKDGTVLPRDVKGKVLGTSRVVARIRFTGDEVRKTFFPTGSWTQAAGEVNTFVGRATVDIPSAAECGTANPGVLSVTVSGTNVLRWELPGTTLINPATLSFNIPIINSVFEPDEATNRALAANIFDSCPGSGRFHLRSLKVDVIATR